MFSALLHLSGFSAIPLASGQSKWLGNVIGGTIPSNENNYWNQATSENGCKWGHCPRWEARKLSCGVNVILPTTTASRKAFHSNYHTFVCRASQEPGLYFRLSCSNAMLF
jgi:endo-1,4-beta-xylanase